jgi:phage-related protein
MKSTQIKDKKQKEWKIRLYITEDGKCPVSEFMETLSEKNYKKMTKSIEYLKSVGIGLRRPQGDYLRDGIYELRIILTNNNYRTLYFFYNNNEIVLTHAFHKTTKKVPES